MKTIIVHAVRMCWNIQEVPRVSITPRNFCYMLHVLSNPYKYWLFCMLHCCYILLLHKNPRYTGYDPINYKLSYAEGATSQPQLFDKRPLFCEWLSELPVDVQKPGKWNELDNPYTYIDCHSPMRWIGAKGHPRVRLIKGQSKIHGIGQRLERESFYAEGIYFPRSV